MDKDEIANIREEALNALRDVLRTAASGETGLKIGAASLMLQYCNEADPSPLQRLSHQHWAPLRPGTPSNNDASKE